MNMDELDLHYGLSSNPTLDPKACITPNHAVVVNVGVVQREEAKHGSLRGIGEAYEPRTQGPFLATAIACTVSGGRGTSTSVEDCLVNAYALVGPSPTFARLDVVDDKLFVIERLRVLGPVVLDEPHCHSSTCCVRHVMKWLALVSTTERDVWYPLDSIRNLERLHENSRRLSSRRIQRSTNQKTLRRNNDRRTPRSTS